MALHLHRAFGSLGGTQVLVVLLVVLDLVVIHVKGRRKWAEVAIVSGRKGGHFLTIVNFMEQPSLVGCGGDEKASVEVVSAV
eukprot:scaffold132_cov170-Amphora_coffeaeformis.AAC.15